jgi:hypothetical protein
LSIAIRLALVQSGDVDANGGTSKQSTVMFGGKPDVSHMSIWSVKCALLLTSPCPALGCAAVRLLCTICWGNST